MKAKGQKTKSKKKSKSGTRRIGLLHSGKRDNFLQQVGALKFALKPLDVEIVEKYAADVPGDVNDNLDYFAKGLVQDSTGTGPDILEVIVAAGGPKPALLLQEITRQKKPDLPIVFTTVVDPEELGLVDTLKIPKWNLTGMAGQTSERDPERLEMLFVLAGMSKGDGIGVLVSEFRPKKDDQYKHIEKKADGKKLKLKLRRKDVSTLDEIKTAFDLFKGDPEVKGVLVTADSLFNDLREDVVRCANASGLPTIYQWKEFVVSKGLISFGPDILEAYGKAGEYVKEILEKKNSPPTMACSKPSVFKVYMNCLTAKDFKITVPNTLLGYPVDVI